MAAFHSQKGPELVDKLQSFTPQASARAEMRQPIKMRACVYAQSCQTLCDWWTIAFQAALSMGFSRQEYWHGLPFPSPGALPNPGVEPASLTSPTVTGGFFTTSAF